MSGQVRIVTDSTAGLSAELVAAHAITVVPLQLTAGSHSGREGVDVATADVLAALSARESVTTSRPTPQAFAASFAAASGPQGAPVVAVLISGALSGTVEAAELAAQASADSVGGEPVAVVDSRSTAMGLGFVVLAAARAAAAGRTAVEVAAAARAAAAKTQVLFYLPSLEWLRRGGRIGAASALLGSALAVKPLLHMVDGAIVPLEKVRTSSRALSRLQELAVAAAGHGRADMAVLHLGAPEAAAGLAAHLRAAVPDLGELYVAELGAVVGTHTGPGALGVAIAER